MVADRPLDLGDAVFETPEAGSEVAEQAGRSEPSGARTGGVTRGSEAVSGSGLARRAALARGRVTPRLIAISSGSPSSSRRSVASRNETVLPCRETRPSPIKVAPSGRGVRNSAWKSGLTLRWSGPARLESEDPSSASAMTHR
jgi:hypothetical protein